MSFGNRLESGHPKDMSPDSMTGSNEGTWTPELLTRAHHPKAPCPSHSPVSREPQELAFPARTVSYQIFTAQPHRNLRNQTPKYDS